MEQFGEYLKAQREKKGIRLEEIASITKIHLHSLELLEESRWEQLPPEPFLRGFIIAYAKYIGLDPKEILAKYLKAMAPGNGSGAEAAGAPHPVPASSREVNRQMSSESPSDLIQANTIAPTKRILATGLCLVVLAALGGFILVGRRSLLRSLPVQVTQSQGVTTTSKAAIPERATSAVAPSPEAMSATQGKEADGKTAQTIADKGAAVAAAGKTVTATTSSETAGAKKNGAAAVAESAHELVVEVKHKSWAKVVADDKPAVETILQEGQKATYKAKSKIKLVLGNSSGATVTHNGEVTTGVKYDGTIRFYVFPVGARFTQDSRHVPRKAAASSDDDDSEED